MIGAAPEGQEGAAGAGADAGEGAAEDEPPDAVSNHGGFASPAKKSRRSPLPPERVGFNYDIGETVYVPIVGSGVGYYFRDLNLAIPHHLLRLRSEDLEGFAGRYFQEVNNWKHRITPSTNWENMKEVLGDCGRAAIHTRGSSNPFGSIFVYGCQNIAFEIGKGREDAVARAGIVLEGKNWPPFFLIIHQDAAYETPIHLQRMQHVAFTIWSGVIGWLYWNFMAKFTARIKGEGVKYLFLAIIYFIAGNLELMCCGLS